MNVVCFGEIMLRLSPFHFQRLEQAKRFNIEYGGSESNVAASLAQLDVDVKYITRVPDNSFGQSALGWLASVGVHTRHSILGGDRLGVYYVELGAGRRNSRVIYDRAQSGMATLQPGMIDWMEILKDADWFHWSGITPAISHSAAEACKEALEAARRAGLTISCDLNYRSKLWKYGLSPNQIMPDLIRWCDVVVGDEDVLEIYFGIKSNNMVDAFEKMQTQFPNVQYISFTDRQAYSATHNSYQGFIYHGGIVTASKKYDMPDIVDRIGTGDAYMAGLIYKLRSLTDSSRDLDSVIEFATATAVYKHYVPGDLNVFTIADVESLMSGSTGGKVKR